ncbi:MAG: hypothetical protein ACYC8T_13290 [Myxococcaceae bacterium]
MVGISLVFAIPGGLLNYTSLPAAEPTLAQTMRSIRLELLYDSVVGLIATLACLAMFVGAAEGRTVGVGEALREATSRWPRVFWTNLRCGFWTGLYSLLLVIPGIWMGVVLAFASESAFRIPDEDPLDVSKSLVRGRWWPVAGVLAGCVLLPALPVLVLSGVAEALMPEAPPPLPRLVFTLVEDWLWGIAVQLTTALSLAAFYGLMRTHGRTLAPMRWAADR